MTAVDSMERLLDEARACRACEPALPLGARPIMQAYPEARLLIASQAPGRLAHQAGVPFADPSGRRLRGWMGISDECFYDPRRVAIVPMGFCYPGHGKSGDLPPRRECAALWRTAFLEQLADVRLTLVIGNHAQRWHLGARSGTVAEAAYAWLSEPGNVIPLPHPSPRNNAWISRHPWFERDLLPRLRLRVSEALEGV